MTDRRPRGGLSLKWFLIGATLLGVGGGTLYRWLVTEPAGFQWVLGLLCGPLPILVLLGTAIRSAVRSRGAWETPTCAQCGAELELAAANLSHVCQQCGAELDRLEHVRFKRSLERDYRALRWIGAALALPLIGLATIALCFPKGRTYAPVSTENLIANHLDIHRPSSWQELEYRASIAALTSEHIDALLGKVTAMFVEQRKQGGASLHLPWARKMLAKPRVIELASDEALSELASVVYQPKLTLSLSPLQPDAVELVVQAPGAGPFLTFPFAACWAVVGFTADGEAIPFSEPDTLHAMQPGGCVMKLDGPFDVVRVEVKVSVFRGAQKINGFDTLPRSSRALHSEEEAIKTWTLSTKKKVLGR